MGLGMQWVEVHLTQISLSCGLLVAWCPRDFIQPGWGPKLLVSTGTSAVTFVVLSPLPSPLQPAGGFVDSLVHILFTV
jgi:hypothetical protein